MIRFILMREEKRGSLHISAPETILVDCPELEKALTYGGINRETDEFEIYRLVGAEVVKEKAP